MTKTYNNFKKVVFVTGGLGFIGSNYLNLFVPKNPKTLYINIDCLTSAGNLRNIEISKYRNFKWAKLDVRDFSALDKLFKKYKPSGLINFAAESHVDASLNNPKLFIETNVVGTHNLLELSRKYKILRFLQISTDEVYGALTSKRARVFNERTLLAPNNPYSASKAAAEHLVRAYHRTFGLDVVTTRSSNNYGPNQDKTKLIPLFITNLLNGKKIPLYGKGEQMREWLYVSDHVRAIDLVYRKGKSGEIYNIGSGEELSNLQLTNKLLALTGRDKSLIKPVTDRLGHDFRYALSINKIKRELGWKPKVTFEKGLALTLTHYRNL